MVIFYPLHRFLRTLFLAALFCVRAFLLHLPKRFCHVFDLMPNFKAYVDRGTLRSSHRDTIAGPRVDLDDLLLFEFVLHTEDEPCIVRADLEIVDDCPFDLRSERSQDVRYQIVGKRPFLLRALHKHRDRRPNALIDEDGESLFLVAKKNGEAIAGRSYGTDVHFDNGLTHTASLYSPSDRGLAQITKSDKACSLMEWNDSRRCSFAEVKEILLSADI